MYHNTTLEEGQLLIKFQEEAKGQDQIILALLRKHGRLTASQALRLYPGEALKTSIRRSLSDFTKPEYKQNPDGSVTLVRPALAFRTNVKSIGPFGRPEYYYQII